jgi:hypothetical protein
VQLAALPLLAPGVLEGLSARLSCSKLEEARWWASVYQDTLSYVRQRLAQLEIKPPGNPDGKTVKSADTQTADFTLSPTSRWFSD